ncbi:MAG: DNA polymerase ligase N-terminal domain-containing protein [Planctomycetota bacterium]
MSLPQDRRFVLLDHQPGPQGPARGRHWDLMLEADGVLKTWALAQDPTAPAWDGTIAIEAEQLPDHRIAYLDYEGVVSQGRGTVERVDAGTWSATRCAAEEWQITLRGRILHGRYRLWSVPKGWQCVRLGE